MGPAISALRKAITAPDREAEEQAKQDLDILQRLVDTKLDEYEAALNA